MEESRSMAMAYYEKLTEEKKTLVQQLFNSMDKDGDGKIEAIEFLQYFETNPQMNYFKRSPSSLLQLFNSLDKDRNNSLDKTEFITFFYLLYYGVCCDKCEDFLNGKTYFTCSQCLIENTTFHVCRSCFSSMNFTHIHGDGTIPVFRDTGSLVSKVLQHGESSSRSTATMLAQHGESSRGITATKLAQAAATFAAGRVVKKIAVELLPDEIEQKAHEIFYDLRQEILDGGHEIAHDAAEIAVGVSDVVELLCNLM